MMPVALRAMRFGWHLLFFKPKHLLDELVSQAASIICYPLWIVLRTKPEPQAIVVLTDRPVAATSPDHMYPIGTATNSRRSFSFVFGATIEFGTGSFLDLGCAHGDLVADMNSYGWKAVGIEGSDYNRVHHRRAWAKHDGNLLFTADIGKPFVVLDNGRIYKATLITAWHVLEHLPENEIHQALENAKGHLAEQGRFVVVTVNNSEQANGVERHLTQWTKQQWRAAFSKAGFTETTNPFPRCCMYRSSPDQLEFVLKHRPDMNRSTPS